MSASADPRPWWPRFLVLLGLALLFFLTTARVRTVRSGEEEPHPPAELELRALLPPARTAWLADVPPAPNGATAAKGRTLFQARCASCHGPEGRGNGAMARHLTTVPADLTRGRFKLRTTLSTGAMDPADIYRTIRAGIPPSGMPSFEHLTASQLWSLVRFVESLAPTAFDARPVTFDPLPVPGEPLSEEEEKKARRLLIDAGCVACHGKRGAGDGPAAATLPVQPRNWTRGPNAFKAGARPADIVRVLRTGMGRMPSYDTTLDPEELTLLGRFVARIAREGEKKRLAAWRSYFADRRQALHEGTGPDKPASPDERVPPEKVAEEGCLACHNGLEPISEGPMMDALLAVSGGRRGSSCVVCHEGNAGAPTAGEAHRGMFPNPGSMWVVGIGLGCAKCHSGQGELTTLAGRSLPEPVGGSLMSVVSKQNDPTGATGGHHVYRMQRALMATESGKANHVMQSGEIVPTGHLLYADFALQDPDGPKPKAGSSSYEAWLDAALARGTVRRLTNPRPVPTYNQALEKTNNPVAATYADYYRKDCAKCHIWGRGPAVQGQHRSAGCTACHVVYNEDGTYEGKGKNVPRGEGHPRTHRITQAVPNDQCIKCHVAYAIHPTPEVHLKAGMACVDCHTSIDLHGDGNIYPSKQFQVEIRCEDCHGTPGQYPWELPLGRGSSTVLEGERGTHVAPDGAESLITHRGNVKRRWKRVPGKKDEPDRVVIEGAFDGKSFEVPLLSPKTVESTCWRTAPEGFQEKGLGSRHMSSMSCASCHTTATFRCVGCHVTVDRRKTGTDWLLSAQDYDPSTRRPRDRKTKGGFLFDQIGAERWATPAVRPDLRGSRSPFVPGCKYYFTLIDEEGNEKRVVRDKGHPSILATMAPHEGNAMDPRSCASCHTRKELKDWLKQK